MCHDPWDYIQLPGQHEVYDEVSRLCWLIFCAERILCSCFARCHRCDELLDYLHDGKEHSCDMCFDDVPIDDNEVVPAEFEAFMEHLDFGAGVHSLNHCNCHFTGLLHESASWSLWQYLRDADGEIM